MQCPFDATTLQTIQRQGIDIEWCSSCKGVWLERGELDKIIERSNDRDDDDDYRRRPEPRPEYRERDYRDSDRYYRDSDGYYPKKRKSFLSELFD